MNIACNKMEDIKDIEKLEEKGGDRLRHAFLKGMSEVLVLGKKPKTKKFYNYLDALNHDVRFLREDLIEALIKLIKELPPEKKIELKNKILELEVDQDWDDFTFEFEENKKIGE